MAQIFISYTRKDLEAAKPIVGKLQENNFDIWIDWEDIPKGEEFYKEIDRAIEAADVFIFLLSPASVESIWCQHELDHAVKNGKRILPILIYETPAETIHPEIAKRNWIFCRQGQDSLDQAITEILTAIHTDYEWLEFQNDLQRKATEWEENQRDTSFLLHGKALRDTAAIFVASSSKEPLPTILQRDYILESQRAEERNNPFRILNRVSRRRDAKPNISPTDNKGNLIQFEVQPVEVGKLFSVSTDHASGIDQLNYARFADAFATLIRNPEAKTPITIGIYGQWGSGKSFLMKKIIEALKNNPNEKSNSLIKKIAGWFAGLFKQNKNPQVDTIIIEFNAWVYSGSEHLWASLVTHLYREIEKYFGVHAHYHRLINAIKRFFPKTIGVFIFYGFLGLIISLLFSYIDIQNAGETLKLAIKTVGASVVGGSILASLPVLWSALREFADTLFMSRAMNLQKLAAKPDFRDQIGIMADIKSEIGFIAHLLENRNKRRQTRVVLFIDDLDRCEHRKAVEVLQAIMLLLADRDGSPFVIFLGIDARVIVRAVEEHYGDVLVKAGINGYEYLDKIVQLPFVIPSTSRRDISNYVESLIWTKAEKDLVESKFASKQETDKTDQLAKTPKEPSTTENKNEPEQTLVQSASQMKTEAIPVTFTKPERDALRKCADDIVDNPRKIKRIINIYRFVRLLLPLNFNEHQKVIRWMLLTEQWPLHASWILEEIENDQFLNGKLSKKPNATIMDVYRQVKDNIYSDDMDHLMAIDADAILFNQFIQRQPVFTVKEISNLLYPLTFNLNPAIKSEITKYTARMAEHYIQIQSNRKVKNHKSSATSETKSATVQKAIQEIEETDSKVA